MKILLTGASGFIGSTLARELHNAGHQVVGFDLEGPETLEHFSDFFVQDISNGLPSAAFLSVSDANVLINCAGIGVYTDFMERTAEEIQHVLNVNCLGLILFTRDCIKQHDFSLATDFNIINISSIYGVVPPNFDIYGESGRNSAEIYGYTKSGMINFTRYLTSYFKDKSVRSNVLVLGGLFADQDPSFVESYISLCNVKRMVTLSDVVSATKFLLSPDSAYLSGSVLTLDGGFSVCKA